MSTTQRTQLVAALENAGTEIERLLEQAGEARLAEPGVVGDWSIKDILAHVTAWEQRILAWADGMKMDQRPEPAPWPADMSEEQVNDWIYRHNQDRPLGEVLQSWREMHHKVIETVQGMTGEELLQRKFEWLGGGSLAGAIPGNSYEHLNQHANDIRLWLSTKEGSEAQ